MSRDEYRGARTRFAVHLRLAVIVLAALVGWAAGALLGPLVFERLYTGPALGLGLGLAVGVSLVVRSITK